MMNSAVTFVFFELLLVISTFKSSFCSGSSYVGCVESEREALLRFKTDVNDTSNRLASWDIGGGGGGDCCKWVGVFCNNLTGHVLELHLRNPLLGPVSSFADIETYESSMLVGKINPSLVDLKHLIYLDLSGNDFERIQIPNFFSSLRNLRYLNLSYASFGGIISNQLGSLTNLQYLDLSFNHFEGPILEEIQNLTSLRHLDLGKNSFKLPNWWGKFKNLRSLILSENSISGLIPWSLSELLFLTHLDLSRNKLEGPIPPSLGDLSFLKYLDLSDNKLNGSFPSLGKLSSLTYLGLSNNELSGPIPLSFGELSSLEYLDLFGNKLNGSLPSLGKLSSLTDLVLSNNELSGPIPLSLGELLSLTDLYLSNNSLSGPIPSSFGELSSLEYVDVSLNNLKGTLSEIHFVNLTRLRHFDASGNSLILKVKPDWIPPFQLFSFYMRSCHLGPQFPSWIYSQKDLYNLDISNSGIVGTIDHRSWRSFSQYVYLNFSNNQIHGKIPNLTEAPFRASLDFSSNNFSGPLPRISSNVTRLDFSNNALSGPIFQFLCDEKNESNDLRILNLRNNFLSGELPDCWMSWELLEALYLDNNKFTGNIPNSMGTLIFLESLHLHENSLTGTIPASLGNCAYLEALSLGENEFAGNIPKWIGERLSGMMILSLRSNKFHGPLPLELCHLDSLQILDLASNNLLGTMPRCFSNFSAMVTVDYSSGNNIDHFVDFTGGITEDASLIMKGTWLEFKNTLNLVRIIDLSDNNFSGEIPIEVMNLKALQSLNLSHNFLIGRIPESVGAMRSLESLDFSANQLSGEIPKSCSELTFLSYLNLSDNNLIGKIPSSTQLQSFDASSYAGNDLCGLPLPKNCSVSAVPEPDHKTGGDKTGDEHEVIWFSVSIILGFVVGFWSLIGSLIVNRRWRYRYNLFLDHLVNKLRAVF